MIRLLRCHYIKETNNDRYRIININYEMYNSRNNINNKNRFTSTKDSLIKIKLCRNYFKLFSVITDIKIIPQTERLY